MKDIKVGDKYLYKWVNNTTDNRKYEVVDVLNNGLYKLQVSGYCIPVFVTKQQLDSNYIKTL